VILFQRLLSLDKDWEVIRSFLHAHSKEATLPPHLSSEQIRELPETPGIYLFKDKQHKVIYAGKAINIKKRVLSHFYVKMTKEYKLGQETYYIDHETTGNELIALLLEAEQIRKYYPKYNRVQKRPRTVYQIISYINQRGIIQLALGKTKIILDSVGTFYNRAAAIEKLELLCELFKLCPRYCTLQSNIEVCSHYRINNCEGICEGSELVQDYNKKVMQAIASLGLETQSYVIREKGRHSKEEAFVLIKEGRYQGFGFVDLEVQIAKVEDYEPFLKLQEATYHTNKILSSYLRKQGKPRILFF
jgi:DNA polymerase-3 subunit epsilon